MECRITRLWVCGNCQQCEVPYTKLKMQRRCGERAVYVTDVACQDFEFSKVKRLMSVTYLVTTVDEKSYDEQAYYALTGKTV